MKKAIRLSLCTIVSIAGLGLFAKQLLSQDKRDVPAKNPTQQDRGSMPEAMDPAKMAEMMAKWQKTTVPGEHHKLLGAFVGEWDTVTKIWMQGPGAPPMESTGSSSNTLVFGGRYLRQQVTGTMMGQPFEGIGFTGYDNYKNMYVFSWIENQSTMLLTGKGMADPSGKTLTFYGEMDEPMLDVSGRTVKYVTRIINEDKHIFQIVDLHAGEDYKVIEIVYTRKR